MILSSSVVGSTMTQLLRHLDRVRQAHPLSAPGTCCDLRGDVAFLDHCNLNDSILGA